VYLKTNEEAVAALGLPPPEHDLRLRFVETQLAAVPADPGARGARAPPHGVGRPLSGQHALGASMQGLSQNLSGLLNSLHSTQPHPTSHHAPSSHPLPLATPDDPDLVAWTKLPEPVMRHPPPLPLSCWRDPFCLQRGDPASGREWVMLLASGLRGRGGAVLVFKSAHLLSGEGVPRAALAAAVGRAAVGRGLGPLG
jgi:hypothetical protein